MTIGNWCNWNKDTMEKQIKAKIKSKLKGGKRKSCSKWNIKIGSCFGLCLHGSSLYVFCLLLIFHFLQQVHFYSSRSSTIWMWNMWNQEIFGDKQNHFSHQTRPNPTKPNHTIFLHSLWWWRLPKKPAKLISDEPQMPNTVDRALGSHQAMTSLD